MQYSSPFGSRITYDIDYEDPWTALANAIILCAVDDYLYPERVSTDPNYRYTDRCKAYVRGDVEKFIKSDWFLLLTDIDPDVFIETLKGACENV